MAENETDSGNMDPGLKQLVDDFKLKLKQLITDTVAQVSKDALPDKALQDLTDEDIAAYCDRLDFELKAKLATSFPGWDLEILKKDFVVFENAVKNLKKELERKREGK